MDGYIFVVGGNKGMTALCGHVYFNDFDGFHIYTFTFTFTFTVHFALDLIKLIY